jgi:multisubunit Na+/H+ antiporter MnhB subunit
MTEIYLQLLNRVLTPVLFVITVVLLLRGHDMPGGGFIAGLVAAAGVVLQILSRGSDAVRRSIGRFLQPLIGFGLLLAVTSATIGVVAGGFFKGVWWEIHWGIIDYKIGTPVTFDFGVFFTVIGVTSSLLLGLSETIIDGPSQEVTSDEGSEGTGR